MTKNNFILITSWIFLLIGIAHISRLLSGWTVHIAGVAVPMVLYWIQAFIVLCLSLLGFGILKKEK